jgi:isopenicillin N synthase-like dioxygenase
MTIRTYSQQKAGLTRAINKAKAGPTLRAVATVQAEVVRTLEEWSSVEWKAAHGTNAWPDDWSRWQRALDDAAALEGRWFAPRLEEL